jgi:hypothetical protein
MKELELSQIKLGDKVFVGINKEGCIVRSDKSKIVEYIGANVIGTSIGHESSLVLAWLNRPFLKSGKRLESGGSRSPGCADHESFNYVKDQANYNWSYSTFGKVLIFGNGGSENNLSIDKMEMLAFFQKTPPGICPCGTNREVCLYHK